MQVHIPSTYVVHDKILILKAFENAKRMHKGQFRDSGEPYIVHPIQVAEILMGLEVLAEIIAVGLLHDVLEDTNESFKELEESFGFEIAKLVNEVTKTKSMERITKDHPEKKRKELHHYFLDTIKDPRAALVKIADRLSNMRTIDSISKKRQVENAEETVKMYYPLAEEIGARTIADELDRICMHVLTPSQYSTAHEASRVYRKEIEEKGYHKDKLFHCVIPQKIGA